MILYYVVHNLYVPALPYVIPSSFSFVTPRHKFRIQGQSQSVWNDLCPRMISNLVDISLFLISSILMLMLMFLFSTWKNVPSSIMFFGTMKNFNVKMILHIWHDDSSVVTFVSSFIIAHIHTIYYYNIILLYYTAAYVRIEYTSALAHCVMEMSVNSQHPHVDRHVFRLQYYALCSKFKSIYIIYIYIYIYHNII
jgi:hypothetical protein